MLRWGLIPHWAKDIKVGFSNINVKAEGIDSKQAAWFDVGLTVSLKIIVSGWSGSLIYLIHRITTTNSKVTQ